MTYHVKEMFYSLQGEGARAGRPAVFCRFSGCNLWSGQERHRAAATCQFCDTDFVGTAGQGGGKFRTPEALADAAVATLGDAERSPLYPPYLVCTGGEPALQLDAAAVDAFHAAGFEVAIETNGTRPIPSGLDWVCVSPKAGSRRIVNGGDELKLVFPQQGAQPAAFEHLRFGQFWLQPMDGPAVTENTRAAVAYCLAHPQWRLSLQTHKYLGIR